MTTSKPAMLITGCSSGIGRATALRLERRGRWTVYATARNVGDLRDLETAGCRVLALDVTDELSMRAAVDRIEDEHGRVDVLVNNAGYSQSGAVEAVPMSRVRLQFEANVFGLIALTQMVLPAMRRAHRGAIVNLSSMGGRLVFPGGGIYHATKYAVEAISDALRFELRGFGIRVVIIEPGLIRSRFADTAVGSIDGPADDVYRAFHAGVARATRDAYVKGLASKLAGTPEDVAAVIEKAISTPRPRPRYTVSASARVFINQRRLLGDRKWDQFLRTIYPTPGQ